MPRVLLVDDEKDLLEQTADFLDFEGFEVFSATTGLQGLQMARDQLPDIIVCDINMPELSGFEVLEELQKNSVTSAIPFIFLTARTDSTDRRSGMNLGADDYITKPFNNSDLIAAIRTRLNKKAAFERDRIYSFSHRLISFQENERHNLSAYLQDYFLDPFLGVKTMLDIVQLQSSSSEKQIFNQAIETINRAIQKLNDLTLELSPSLLNHFGLIPALRWLFEQFTARTQVRVDFHHDNLAFDFESDQKIMIYRIIQEGITNVEKHAYVDEVFVKLWIEHDYLNLQIYDEGRGFNVAEVLSAPDSLGLLSMQIRASILGSEITFISVPKEGTKIIAQVPLQQTNQNASSVSNSMLELVHRIIDDAVIPQSFPLYSSETATTGLRIAIVEPNDLIRWGICKLLEMDSRFSVIAESLTAKQTLNLLANLEPDILILSILLPDANSLDFVQQISKEYEKLAILVISNYSEKAYAKEAFANGASGYILKTADSAEMLQALITIASGELYVSEALRDMDDTGKWERPAQETPLDLLSSLTKRELEIFYLVIEGNSNKEIADKLFISARTAETHRMNMMRKLDMKGQATLLRYAITKGIIEPPK
jgi:DNA-binding NarL/FixJ family response regulator/two-component sensor histidine kinase